MKTIVRVGEKNNFNQTSAEFKELDKYKNKGSIFVNSNSFTKIKSDYPSFVTINPYLVFHEPKGDLSNVKAFRIKLWQTMDDYYCQEQIKALKFANKLKTPVLITFMRFRSKLNRDKFKATENYVFDHNYFRPNKETQNWIVSFARMYAKDVKICDANGTGCVDCLNCTKLSYGIDSDVTIKALNLSISGVKDRHGKRGLCPYKCPDCYAKIVTYGKRPACDKLITNLKLLGKVNHI